MKSNYTAIRHSIICKVRWQLGSVVLFVKNIIGPVAFTLVPENGVLYSEGGGCCEEDDGECGKNACGCPEESPETTQ